MEQIEERQRELEEDSYQTNLKIRAVEDEIYDLNRKIRDENDAISAFKDKIEVHNKNIRDYEWQIYDIENDRLKTLEDMKYQNDLLLAGADLAVTKAASTAKIELANFDRQNGNVGCRRNLSIGSCKVGRRSRRKNAGEPQTSA